MNPTTAAPALPDAPLPELAAPPLAALATANDLTPWGLLLQADPVVEAAMLLLLASLACWTVIIEKAATFHRLRREARDLGAMAAAEGAPASLPRQAGLAAAALQAGLPKWRHGQGRNETDGEFRARLEEAMRKASAAP